MSYDLKALTKILPIGTSITLTVASTAAEDGEPYAIFLLDEHHAQANVIQDNAVITRILVDTLEVAVVCSETTYSPSEEPDESDPDTTTFSKLPPAELKLPVGGFVAALRRLDVPVVGVDSPSLYWTIYHDVTHGTCASPSAHPLQPERTLHFVSNALAAFRKSSAKGCIVLNCGTDHNDRILKIAALPPVQRPAWWPRCCFIRIRSRFHP